MKDAYDLEHVKSVTAWALMFEGEYAGRMIANHGKAVTVTLVVWAGPLQAICATGRAAGYGYDKLSGALWDAFNRHGVFKAEVVEHGNGRSEEEFTSRGYTVLRVL